MLRYDGCCTACGVWEVVFNGGARGFTGKPRHKSTVTETPSLPWVNMATVSSWQVFVGSVSPWVNRLLMWNCSLCGKHFNVVCAIKAPSNEPKPRIVSVMDLNGEWMKHSNLLFKRKIRTGFSSDNTDSDRHANTPILERKYMLVCVCVFACGLPIF